MKPRVITIANQKGGVGKTTTTINLGTALAAIGENVLIVDLDPQGNASTGLGIDRKDRDRSVYDVLMGERKLAEGRRLRHPNIAGDNGLVNTRSHMPAHVIDHLAGQIVAPIEHGQHDDQGTAGFCPAWDKIVGKFPTC